MCGAQISLKFSFQQSNKLIPLMDLKNNNSNTLNWFH